MGKQCAHSKKQREYIFLAKKYILSSSVYKGWQQATLIWKYFQSRHLSMAGMARIELARAESKSAVLPLDYIPMWGGRWDSNPRSSVPQTDALGQLRYTHHIGAPEGTRTPGPLLRRQVLYPAELQAPVCPIGRSIWSG